MRLLRFADLRGDNGQPPIVRTWTTLNKLIDEKGFPPGRMIGRFRVWTEAEIERWIEAQPAAKSALRGCTKRLKADKAERASNNGGAK